MNDSKTIDHRVVLKIHPKTLSGKPEIFEVSTQIPESVKSADPITNNQGRMSVLAGLAAAKALPQWNDPGSSFNRHRELFASVLGDITKKNLTRAIGEVVECWKHSHVRHTLSPTDRFQLGVHTQLNEDTTELVVYRV